MQRRRRVLHQRAADDRREGEAGRGGRGRRRARASGAVAAAELDHRRRRGAQREPDAHAHERPSDEHPGEVGGEAERDRTRCQGAETHEDDGSAADHVGEVAEHDEHRHEHDRVDREDRRGHRGLQLPLLRVQRVDDRGRPARPECESGDGCRGPESCALRQCHGCRLFEVP